MHNIDIWMEEDFQLPNDLGLTTQPSVGEQAPPIEFEVATLQGIISTDVDSRSSSPHKLVAEEQSNSENYVFFGK